MRSPRRSGPRVRWAVELARASDGVLGVGASGSSRGGARVGELPPRRTSRRSVRAIQFLRRTSRCGTPRRPRRGASRGAIRTRWARGRGGIPRARRRRGAARSFGRASGAARGDGGSSAYGAASARRPGSLRGGRASRRVRACRRRPDPHARREVARATDARGPSRPRSRALARARTEGARPAKDPAPRAPPPGSRSRRAGRGTRPPGTRGAHGPGRRGGASSGFGPSLMLMKVIFISKPNPEPPSPLPGPQTQRPRSRDRGRCLASPPGFEPG